VILATTASLAADCDEVTAANLNSEVEEELLPLEVSGNLKPSEESKIKELKQRSAEAGIIQIQALDDNNKEELQKHYDSYRSIINETKKINE
jgi:hypothetical protein